MTVAVGLGLLTSGGGAPLAQENDQSRIWSWTNRQRGNSAYEDCKRRTAGQDWFVDPCVQYLSGDCPSGFVWTNRGCVPVSNPPEDIKPDVPLPSPLPVATVSNPPLDIFGPVGSVEDFFDRLRSIYESIRRHPYLYGGAGLVLGYLVYSYLTHRKGKR